MPYIYVDNCAKGVLLAGTTPGVDGETFNLVDDELPTGRQVLRMHRRLVGQVRAFTVPRLAVRPLRGYASGTTTGLWVRFRRS